MYGGGIIINPEFSHGTAGWAVFGKGAIEERLSRTKNSFMVAYNRKRPMDSFSQKVRLEKGKFYTFSGDYSIPYLYRHHYKLQVHGHAFTCMSEFVHVKPTIM